MDEGLFGRRLRRFQNQDLAPWTQDPSAPPGTDRHPLGNPEHAGRSYLLGLHCACGRTSLAYSASVEAGEGVACPACAAALA